MAVRAPPLAVTEPEAAPTVPTPPALSSPNRWRPSRPDVHPTDGPATVMLSSGKRTIDSPTSSADRCCATSGLPTVVAMSRPHSIVGRIRCTYGRRLGLGASPVGGLLLPPRLIAPV